MNLYLIRHGQAGPRDQYDSLSPLGVEQASLLGAHLAATGLQFDAVYAGALRRQQLTAAQVRDAYLRTGLAFPEITVDPRWSEFNLYGVYQGVAPLLAATDPGFRRDYEAMLEDLRDPAAPVHRTWTACDQAVLHAWVNGLFELEVESFLQFRARVEDGLRAACNSSTTGPVAVFTSATPIAVAAARAIGLPQEKFIPLVEALYNSSLTVLRVHDTEPHLATFNCTPHVKEARLRTLR